MSRTRHYYVHMFESMVLTWRAPTGARSRREPSGAIRLLPRRLGPRALLDAVPPF